MIRTDTLHWSVGIKLRHLWKVCNPVPVINLADIRAERRAASVAAAVLADLTMIYDRLIGYFHTDAGNPATDVELRGLSQSFSDQCARCVRGQHGPTSG